MIIQVQQVTKQYNSTNALEKLDLTVEEGGVVGLLGPNGAGKTTLVEILEGLRSPTSGTVRVLGLDPSSMARQLKQRIGVQLQSTAVPEELTPMETLKVFAGLYDKSLPPMEVLNRVGLAERANKVTNRKMSGGERQRLALAMALINDPELIILDEPTIGLDPGGRREMHSHIASLRVAKRTVLLTTHYIEEAEKLCDRVIILRKGRIVADGSPATLALKGRTTRRLFFALKGEFDASALLAAGAQHQTTDGEVSCFTATDPRSVIAILGRLLQDLQVSLIDLKIERPSLEDFYHELMGSADTSRG